MSNFGLLYTFSLFVGSIWLAYMRPSMKADNNWAMVYYFLLVGHLNGYEQALNANSVYTGVVCGLMLRFEFLNPRFSLFVRLIELGALGHIVYCLFEVMRKAYQ